MISVVSIVSHRHSSEGMRIRWRRDTKERYEDSSELWDLRHAQLAAGREKWLEESTRTGMIAGSRAVAVQWDIEAKTLIADAESAVIPSLSIDTPSLSQLVEDATGGTRNWGHIREVWLNPNDGQRRLRKFNNFKRHVA